jgi:hypothetical protein
MCAGLSAGWARDIAGPDARRICILKFEGIFAGDGAVGVEELVGDVSQDSGASRRDAAFGEEDEEAGEELVDVDGGVELGELGEELGGEVEGIIWRMLKPGAEGGTLG